MGKSKISRNVMDTSDECGGFQLDVLQLHSKLSREHTGVLSMQLVFIIVIFSLDNILICDYGWSVFFSVFFPPLQLFRQLKE